LALGRDGAFYGTTYNGGVHDSGTAFRVTTGGTLTTLVQFDGNNGALPYASLVCGNDGALYGTTSSGGSHNAGNIFRLDLNCRMLPLTRTGDGWSISFTGPAGETCRVLRAMSPTGPWTNLATVSVGIDGSGRYTDPAPPAGKAFYQTVRP